MAGIFAQYRLAASCLSAQTRRLHLRNVGDTFVGRPARSLGRRAMQISARRQARRPDTKGYPERRIRGETSEGKGCAETAQGEEESGSGKTQGSHADGEESKTHSCAVLVDHTRAGSCARKCHCGADSERSRRVPGV